MNVSKSTAMVFTRGRAQRPWQILFLETARYLWVTLDTQLTWSAQINQVGRKAVQKFGVLVPLLKRRNGLSIRNGVLLYK
jgi:hypothetical protein